MGYTIELGLVDVTRRKRSAPAPPISLPARPPRSEAAKPAEGAGVGASALDPPGATRGYPQQP